MIVFLLIAACCFIISAAVSYIVVRLMQNPNARFEYPQTPYQPEGEFIRQHPATDIWNLNGVSWFDAPPPPPKHHCWTQTKGTVNGIFVRRCGCGAISMDDHNDGQIWWSDRNSRKVRS